MVDTSTKTSSAAPSSSIEIHPPARTVFPRHRSSTANLSRTCFQLTGNHFQTSGSKVQWRLKRQPHTAGRKQNLFTMPMHITSLRFESDLMLPSKSSETKLWDIHGTILKHRVAVFWCEIVVSCAVGSQHRFLTHRTNNLPKANQRVYRDGPVANAT